jgi:hypothetical protein
VLALIGIVTDMKLFFDEQQVNQMENRSPLDCGSPFWE